MDETFLFVLQNIYNRSAIVYLQFSSSYEKFNKISERSYYILLPIRFFVIQSLIKGINLTLTCGTLVVKGYFGMPIVVP